MISSQSQVPSQFQEEPNLIPLLDFLLVLLIMFVMLAGPIQQALKLNLPKVSEQTATQSIEKESLILTISAQDNFTLADKSYHSLEEVSVALAQHQGNHAELVLNIDKSIPIETVLQAFTVAKSNDLTTANIQVNKS